MGIKYKPYEKKTVHFMQNQEEALFILLFPPRGHNPELCP